MELRFHLASVDKFKVEIYSVGCLLRRDLHLAVLGCFAQLMISA